MRTAARIAKAFGRILYDDLLFLHTSVLYLCCLTDREFYDKVVPAVRSVPWRPFNVSFDKAHCNFDNSTNRPNATTTSIVVLLSRASQLAMSSMVLQFETAIRRTGLPVQPRSGMEPFHSTLAVVPRGFPTVNALDAINAGVTDWTLPGRPIVVRSFESILPPYLFESGAQR